MTSGIFIYYYCILYDNILYVTCRSDWWQREVHLHHSRGAGLSGSVHQTERESVHHRTGSGQQLPDQPDAWEPQHRLTDTFHDSKLCDHFTQLLVISTYWTVYDIKLSSPSTWQQWLCIVVKKKVNMWENSSLRFIFFGLVSCDLRLLLRLCHTGAARG